MTLLRGHFIPQAEADRPFAQPTEQQLAAAVKHREEVLGIRQYPTDEEIRLKLGRVSRSVIHYISIPRSLSGVPAYDVASMIRRALITPLR